jgi:hypothetical protein
MTKEHQDREEAIAIACILLSAFIIAAAFTTILLGAF